MQAEAEDHAKFVVTGIASAYLLPAMKIKPLPAATSHEFWVSSRQARVESIQ
jgi:hypothetical protein